MLNLNGTYFWAGFNGADIRFRRVAWGGTNQFWLTNVGQIVGIQGQGVPKALGLVVAGLSPSRGVTRFRIDMPARMRTSLVLYDVMGRRVRSLVDREMAAGPTEVTWDGRDQSGVTVGTGMYFARMLAGGTSHVVRVPLVR
jgi:flagellar hook assembly protein FlgD